MQHVCGVVDGVHHVLEPRAKRASCSGSRAKLGGVHHVLEQCQCYDMRL
jgi:hypothetical protein